MNTLRRRLGPPDWTREAACRGADLDTFFEGTTQRTAKEWCGLCPVRQACLDTAMAEEGGGGRGRYGVRGGLTGDERKALYKKRQRHASQAAA